MGKVYIEQTDLTLSFEAGKSLNISDVVKIEYISPQKVRGLFNATISDAIKGTVVFNVNNSVSEFKTLGAGTYIMWLNITDGVTGLVSIGEPTSFNIYSKGT